MKYKEVVFSIAGKDATVINRINDDESIDEIPLDEFNVDYQAYLAWKAENE